MANTALGEAYPFCARCHRVVLRPDDTGRLAEVLRSYMVPCECEAPETTPGWDELLTRTAETQ